MTRDNETKAKRRQFFALATARHNKRRGNDRKYKEVEPGVWISTCA